MYRGRGLREARDSSPAVDQPAASPIRHSGEGRNPEGRGLGNVVRGLVPRWGGGGAWQNPRCQIFVRSHNSSFSYRGVPAPAGMSDWYESMSRTPIRDRPLRQTLIGRSRHPFVYPVPHFVICML